LKPQINQTDQRFFLISAIACVALATPLAAAGATVSPEEGEISSVPLTLPAKSTQVQVSGSTDVVGPVTWQLLVRPREHTRRFVDHNYLSYAVRARFDWALPRGSIFFQPVYRLYPENSRTDTRDFTEISLGFIQWSRFSASSYGAGVGWAVGSMDEWSAWRPWVAISVEKSDVTADILVSDLADDYGRRYRLESSLMAAYASFGISWTPLATLPGLGLEPSVMLPAGSMDQSGSGRNKDDQTESLLYQELDHRTVAGISLALSAQVRF